MLSTESQATLLSVASQAKLSTLPQEPHEFLENFMSLDGEIRRLQSFLLYQVLQLAFTQRRSDWVKAIVESLSVDLAQPKFNFLLHNFILQRA